MKNPSVELGPYASIILQLMLTFIMLSVSLELKKDDWNSLKHKWKAFLTGMSARILVLPAIIFCFCSLAPISAELKLGFLLVAACPGGSISNFLVSLSRGDIILSILLSLGSTFLAPLSTPLNFEFWALLADDTRNLFSQISIDPQSLLKTIFFSLLIPLSIGAYLGLKHPEKADKLKKKTNFLGPSILLLFLIFAVTKNYQLLAHHFFDAFIPVVILNTLCLLFFYFYAKIFQLPPPACRAISLEVSVENTALALLIALEFFPNHIEVTMVAVLWGLWQIFSGWILAHYWSKNSFSTGNK